MTALKLFEKIGRRMELTQAGKDIMPYIDLILQGTEQIGNYGKSLSEISGNSDSQIIHNTSFYSFYTLHFHGRIKKNILFGKIFIHVQLIIKSLSEISGSLKLAIPDSILIYNMQPFMQAFTHEAFGKIFIHVQLIIAIWFITD